MLKNSDGVDVYIVAFDTMPEMPIRWDNRKEEPYARALHAAINDGVIKEPGMYGIHIDSVDPRDGYTSYSIYTLIEK